MMNSLRLSSLAIILLGAALTGALRQIQAIHAPRADVATSRDDARRATPSLDMTGRKRVGTASIYAAKFAGRKMADGTPMQLQADNAASKTLPLGTTARVTNLETGRAAIVTIRDRGPYVKDRIVDLSPSTARKIGLAQSEGLAEVEVVPIAFPASLATKTKRTDHWDN